MLRIFKRKKASKERITKASIKRQRDMQATFIGVVLTIIFVVLGYRIFHIQTVQGDEYRRLAVRQQNRQQQGTVSREIPASRGEIMDRHMQPLIESIPVYEVFFDVNLLHAGSQEARSAHLAAINRYLRIPILDLEAHFDQDIEGNLINPVGASHRILAREVEPELAHYLSDNFTHIHATRMTQRRHVSPFFAPQVLGFIRGDSLHGLESAYNIELTGTAGRSFLVQGETQEVAVRNGFSLITTLDSDIQRIAQASVDQAFLEMDADFVGMIVMDPFTGEILAMAQAPTFSIAEPLNPQTTTDTWLQNNWDYLSEARRHEEFQRMWQNFNISHAYEPGSIFKPIVIAAALEENLIDTNMRFNCTGARYLFTERVPCWNVHGPLSLTEAIYRSCNMAMFYIMDALGRDNFYRYRGYFGFGSRTGIDLPAETAVSSPVVMYTFANLGPVELLTSSIGQGFNASAIQSINAYAALINGGSLMQPFVVSQIIDEFGNIVYETQPTIVRRVISGTTSDIIRTQMRYVVTAPGGTANPWSYIPGYSIGGKTGTGQQGARDAGINSLTYIAFTPVENPEFLVLMVAHNVCDDEYGGAGREIGPRVRDFFQQVINLRGMQPFGGTQPMYEWRADVMGAAVMPDYSGQRLADAVRDLSTRSNGGYQVIGSGITVSHTFPVPGREMPQTSTVFFYMDSDSRIEGQMVEVPNLVNLTVSQAELVLLELNLPPMRLDSLAPQSIAGSSDDARTFNVEARDDDNEYDSPVQVNQYIIYQQFPSPGTELERGTWVMFRAR